MFRSRIALLLSVAMLLMLPSPVMAATPTTGPAPAPRAALVESSITLDYAWDDLRGSMPVILDLYGVVAAPGATVTSGTVQLESSLDGVSWTSAGETTTSAQYPGAYSFSFHPEPVRPTYYRTRFLGNGDIAPSVSRSLFVRLPVRLVEKARFTAPVAYDIRSLKYTTFEYSLNRYNLPPGSRARLVVHGARSDGGPLTLFDRAVDGAHYAGTFVWNGRDDKGQRLPASGNYRWTLYVSTPGIATQTGVGGVVVCRVLFSRAGTSQNGDVQSSSGYMVPGVAKVYVEAYTTLESGDTLTIKLTGPFGFTTPSRSFLADNWISTATTYSGASAPRYRGIHTLSAAAKRHCAYRFTVIQ